MEIWKALQEKTKEFRWSKLARPVAAWVAQFHWVAIGLVLVLVLLNYTNLEIFRFSPNDEPVLASHPQIRDAVDPAVFFRTATSKDDLGGSTYRPVAIFSFAIENLRGTLDPISCRHVNVALHAICGLLVYWMVWQLAPHRGFACAVALLFVMQPLATSTVGYLSTRGELLATLGSLVSLNLFLRAKSWSGFDRFVLCFFSVLAFAAAVFSAESALLVPALVFAYLLAFERGGGWKRWSWLAGFVAVEVLYLGMRYQVLGGWGWTPGPDWELSDQVEQFLKAVGASCRLLFSATEVPLDGTLIGVASRWFTVYLGLGVLAMVILLAVLWFCRQNLPEPWFGAAWALVGLLPLWELQSRTGLVAESWLYFPSIGIWLVGAALVVLFLRGRKRQKLWRGIVISAVCAIVWWFGERTSARVNDWHTETLPLAQSLIKTHPAAQYHYRLGVALAQLDLTTNAIEQLEIAQKIDPTMAVIATPLAILLTKSNPTDDAMDRLRQAIQSEPTNTALQVQMADVLLRKKQIAEALPYLTAAASAPAPDAWACQKLAWVLATAADSSIRNGTAAVKWGKRAQNLTASNDADALDALAAAYAETGDYPEACRWAAKAAEVANKHGQGAKAKAIRSRYGSYTQRQPYREGG